MSDLQKRSLDKDLVVLDEIVGDSSIPTRDWSAIISLYERNNSLFPIPAGVCVSIIQRVKEGQLPKMVFKEQGASYTQFKNRYNKVKSIIEELSVLPSLSDAQWQIIHTCKNDPYFLLGQDLERASAFHFNQSTKKLEKLSMNAQTWIEYMKLVHPEEFEEESENKNVQVVIKVGVPGLLESI